MFKYLWSPFKWIGRQLRSVQSTVAAVLFLILGLAAAYFSHSRLDFFNDNSYVLAICFLSIALLLLLFAFSSRGSALTAWFYLLLGQTFIFSGALINAADVHQGEVIYYASGIVISFLLGLYCLYKTKAVDDDIMLDKHHGYVYENKVTAVLFLLAAIGLLGFPVTAAFIGIDVFFTYVESGQGVLITLLGLCFIFVELAAIRIFLRIYMGPHKKLYHPVAFRSS
jgi:NADH-quinone oxidoreductase subunit L